MNNSLDATHDPALRSWVASANDPASDFPLQNLPLGRFRPAPDAPWRGGIAIGDQVLDLQLAAAQCPWDDPAAPLVAMLGAGDIAGYMALGRIDWRALRAALSAALAEGSSVAPFLEGCLVPRSRAEMALPCAIGDYTDFYAGIHHARSVGRQFRPDAPLLPNYMYVPIGYHGRASSIGIGGSVRRPSGQTKANGGEQPPVYGPSRRLDHELEVGAFVGGPENALGTPLTMAEAEARLFGLVLLNDWSARDIQAWEYQPLGPFLAKSFATSISPWIVSMEALAPFRRPFTRAAGDPAPLPYLDSAANRAGGAIDVVLEAWLETPAMSEPVRISQSNMQDAYWTFAQLLTHHASNGCNLRPCDLLGSGTLSGVAAGQGGSLLELSNGGREPIVLPNGERRAFLKDGDTLTLKAHARAPNGVRIGFGGVSGTIVAAAQAT